MKKLALLFLIISFGAHGKNEIPGTSLKANIPQGFTPATQFKGFEYGGGRFSIFGMKIEKKSNNPTEKPLTLELLPSTLLKAGGKILEEQAGNSGGFRTLLIKRETSNSNGGTYWQWIYCIDLGTSIDAAVVNFVNPSDSDYSKKLVLSAEKSNAPIDHFAGFPLRLDLDPKMKPSNIYPNSVSFTRDGKPKSYPIISLMILANVNEHITMADTPEVIKAIKGRDPKKPFKLETTTPVKVGKWSGFEFIGLQKEDGQDTRFILQMMSFGNDTIIAEANCVLKDCVQDLPTLRKMLASLRMN